MSWFKRKYKQAKNKVQMNILTKVVDYFKAKNPKVFAYVQGALLILQGFLITSIALSTQLTDIPFITDSFPWIADIPTTVAGVLSGITYALQVLTGSSTPGTTVPIRLTESKEIQGENYNKGEITFVKKEVADKLQDENSAIKLPLKK